MNKKMFLKTKKFITFLLLLLTTMNAFVGTSSALTLVDRDFDNNNVNTIGEKFPEVKDSITRHVNEANKANPNFIESPGYDFASTTELNPPILAENFVVTGDPDTNYVDISFDLLRNGNTQVLNKTIFIDLYDSNYSDFCQMETKPVDCAGEYVNEYYEGADTLFGTTVTPIDAISVAFTNVELPFVNDNYIVPNIYFFFGDEEYNSLAGYYVGDGTGIADFDYTLITKTNDEYRINLIVTSDMGARVIDTVSSDVICDYGDIFCTNMWLAPDGSGNFNFTTELQPGFSIGDGISGMTYYICDYSYYNCTEYDTNPIVHPVVGSLPLQIIAFATLDKLPVYRFWSTPLQAHFYTISETDKDTVISTWPTVWTYEGPKFNAAPLLGDNTCPDGTSPIYRFWSNLYQNHFYTISEADKDMVIATWPTIWSLEGPKMCGSDGTMYFDLETPVHRFWSSQLGSHFYTSSEEDVVTVQTNWPDVWTYEGIKFYLDEYAVPL